MRSPAIFSFALCLLPAMLVVQTRPKAHPSIEVSSNADCSSAKGLERVICLANAFKATLNADQLAVVQLPYSKENAVRWSNFPQGGARPKRVGINFGSLNVNQLKAAKALMASVLVDDVPNEGFDEMEGGLAADDFLGVKTGKTDFFSSKNFYIAFLGTPGTSGLWELQYGGHHYAFANTYNNGKITGSTPSFRGVEPIAAVEVDGKIYQPVEQERKAFAALLESLSATERASAKLSVTFSDILLGPGQDGKFPVSKQGFRVGNPSPVAQKLVLNAVRLYVNDLDTVTATDILAQYTKELPDTYLAYSGSNTMSEANDYVRLDGPGIWIEYCGQASRDIPGTVHPHAVWRDHRSDYGGN